LAQTGYAQEGKLVVVNLKKGYPVKGKIIEQTASSVKIELSDGDIFECKPDEIASIDDAQPSSSSSKNIFKEIKPVPQIYKKGDKILSFGIGSSRDDRLNISGYYSETPAIPFIPVSFEYILKDDVLDDKCAIGIGGLCEYYSLKTKYFDDKEYTINYLFIAARGYAHYSVIKKLDTYGGLAIGYYKAFMPDFDASYSYRPGWFYYFLGSRYYFNKKIAGMVELGSGISWLTFGVALRM
jgi:hypothetical protein